MKTNTFLFIAIVFSFLIASCDYVTEPYENITPIAPVDTSNNESDTLCTPDTTKTIRKILIEDFTGHTCGNCPEAGIVINNLESAYGDTIVAVAVHSGFFAEPYPSGTKYTSDYRTTAGTEYNTLFGNDVAGNPNGLINRSEDFNGSKILQPSQWASACEFYKTKRPTAHITLKTEYNSTTRVVTVDAASYLMRNFSGNYSVIIYILENNIIDWQKDYSQSPTDVSNYQHKHMLRDNLNGIWGESIISGSASLGDCIKKTYSYTLNSEWKQNDCIVVAYIYNQTTYEVIQVEEAHVVHP